MLHQRYLMYNISFEVPKIQGLVLEPNIKQDKNIESLIHRNSFLSFSQHGQATTEDLLPCDTSIQTFNLQFFARPEDEGRTEQPTPRKIERARQRGQVTKSTELTSAGLSLITIIVFLFIGYYMFTELVKFVYNSLSMLHENRIEYANFSQLVISHLLFYFKIALPIMLVACLSALFLEASQVGLYFAPKALMPDFIKIKPNFGRIFQKLTLSKKALVDYGKTFFKLGVISYFTYRIISSEYHQLILLVDMDVISGFLFIAKLSGKIILIVTLFLLIMSFFDYLYQRYEFRQGLMMSRYELKDEWKQLEGDPLMRSKIRQRQRQMATRRMMAEVPKADVIITNPIHLAIAIKYDTGYMNAPMVIAKGMDHIAEKIVEIANQYGVPLIENKPLAKAIYDAVDINQQITPELYQAIAEVLAFVYQLKQR